MMTPRTQAILIGHADIERTILQSWQQGRLHHGMIFVGPKGVGKATCAYRLARFLLSSVTPSDQPATLAVPSENSVFSRVASGGHGDLLVIEPNPDLASAEVNIDRVRPIRRFLSQTPMEGGWRIVIIDGLMNRNAANALLKSLEEPPKNTLIILIAEALGNLSPTIRSRCIQYSFSNLEESDTRAVVQTLYPEFGQEQLQPLIALCCGRPGYVATLKGGDAILLYQHLIANLLSLKLSPLEAVIPFCHKYAAKPKKGDLVDLWELIGELFPGVMHRLILVGQDSLGVEAYLGEQDHLASLLSWRSLPAWSMVLGQVMQDYATGRISHLDRFQVLVGAMDVIAKGVQRSAAII